MIKAIVYKTNNCPWCEKVLNYLHTKGVEVDVRNCTENEEYRTELITKTMQSSVPVIEIGRIGRAHV